MLYNVVGEDYAKEQVVKILLELSILDLAYMSIDSVDTSSDDSFKQYMIESINEKINMYRSQLSIHTYYLDKIRYADYVLASNGNVDAISRNNDRSDDSFYDEFPKPSSFVKDNHMEYEMGNYYKSILN